MANLPPLKSLHPDTSLSLAKLTQFGKCFMKSEIYWINGPWPGRLAIMPRPRSGDWLDDEIQAWKADGVGVVVSLLEDEETEELGLTNEPKIVLKAGIEFVAFPIKDRGVPDSRKATQELLHKLDACLANGLRVAVHCRAGIGRSAMIAASLLALSGMDVEIAFKVIEQARGCAVPDTNDQKKWVERFIQDTTAPTR